MEFDPIGRLTNKVSEFQKERDILEKRLKKEKEDVVVLRDKLEKVKEEYSSKKAVHGKSAKASHLEKIVSGTEESLKKIVNSSLAFEAVLDNILTNA